MIDLSGYQGSVYRIITVWIERNENHGIGHSHPHFGYPSVLSRGEMV